MANVHLPTRRTVFRAISISVVILLVAVAVLGLYVYRQSVGKFEIRRLSLPTRIYADYTPLRSGLTLSSDDVLEKLSRLGYRQAANVAQPGDFSAANGQVDLFLRAFKHPSGDYPAQPVRLTFKGPVIDQVVSLREARPLDNAALEPELLTSILSDQLENRRPVTLNQVSPQLIDAVISTEDVRFFHHPGIDPIGMSRAVFRNLRAGGVSEGASTLTQQLVKNYYLTSERTYKRKITEAFMAVVLDAKYSKNEILEAYLNDIYLGRNRSISIIGVGEASRFYFGKPVAELTLPEAALLAGMIRGPNNYSPFTRADRALERRNTVLGLMLKYKKITPEQYQQAVASPLPRKPFRERSGLGSIPFYVDRVLQEMARDYGIKDVKGRGLQIYTAIDLNAQDLAARTVEAGLQNLEKSRRLRKADNPLQGVLIHVDVQSGEIRALIGGRNYDQSQFNRALNSTREVGSLIKPIVYTTAFEPSVSDVKDRNITPSTLVSDQRFVLKRKFSADWSPRNYQDEYHGTVTVREALEESMNAASVRIGLSAGVPNVIKTAQTLGIAAKLEDNPSLLLGAVSVPPIQMADAYSTLARIGSRLPLRTIRFVTDDRGKVVSAGDDVKPVQVFPARDVYLTVHLMEGVVDRGTAAGARTGGFRLRAAGKTGTTNDERDAWFIGFTPSTLTLTWVGFDDNTPVGVSGGQGAVPIWTRYMNSITAGQPSSEFGVPQGIEFASVDEASGGLAVAACPRKSVVNEAFKSGTIPQAPCSLHSPQAPALPAVDQFGNPIALDTNVTSTDAGSISMAPAVDTAAPSSPPVTLTGGSFHSDEAPASVPPPARDTAPPPPAVRETPRERPPAPAPQPSEEPPPEQTDTTSTDAPPPPPN